MLVLTPYHKNAIELDDGIRIELIDGKNGQSRLGIVSSKEVGISRVRHNRRPPESSK